MPNFIYLHSDGLNSGNSKNSKNKDQPESSKHNHFANNPYDPEVDDITLKSRKDLKLNIINELNNAMCQIRLKRTNLLIKLMNIRKIIQRQEEYTEEEENEEKWRDEKETVIQSIHKAYTGTDSEPDVFGKTIHSPGIVDILISLKDKIEPYNINELKEDKAMQDLMKFLEHIKTVAEKCKQEHREDMVLFDLKYVDESPYINILQKKISELKESWRNDLTI